MRWSTSTRWRSTTRMLSLSDPIGTLLSLTGALTVPGAAGGYPKPVALDDRARDELRGVIQKLQPEVRAIASASTARAAKG